MTYQNSPSSFASKPISDFSEAESWFHSEELQTQNAKENTQTVKTKNKQFFCLFPSYTNYSSKTKLPPPTKQIQPKSKYHKMTQCEYPRKSCLCDAMIHHLNNVHVQMKLLVCRPFMRPIYNY